VAARKSGFGIQEIKRIVSQNAIESPNLKEAVILAAKRKTTSIDQQIEALEKQRQLLMDAQSCICSDLSTCSIFA